jgi:Family of unknown function (DUF5829)
MGRQLVKTDWSAPISQGSVAAPRPDSSPQAFLNHFYVVLDSPTYKAIEEDEFLRKHFAVNEKRTTTNAEMTYTGLYFYGSNTYLEFFDVDNSPKDRVGDSAIAFGVDRPRSIRVLHEKLGPSLEPKLKRVTRLYRGKQIPWFFMATSTSLRDERALNCWVMEYHPDFLGNWNPQPKRTKRGISRKEILQRYSEVLTPVEKQRLEDVIGLTVAVDASDKKSLIDFCFQLGYQIEKKQNKDVVALSGPDFMLLLISATDRVRGIREIKMRTRSVSEREQEHQLGRSLLKFVGPTAIWSFR